MGGYALIMIMVPVMCSLLCWWLLAEPLRQVTRALCARGESASFWSRAFLLLVLATPLLTILLLAPEQASSSLWLDAHDVLKWSLIGVVAQLLALVRLVWRQVAFSRPSPVKPLTDAVQGGMAQ
ncbi:Transmembrane protein [Chromobacterium violaceum]